MHNSEKNKQTKKKKKKTQLKMLYRFKMAAK